MTHRQPRTEEHEALEVLSAVENVATHQWLQADREPTPDLKIQRVDGRTVYVEITMVVSRAILELLAASRSPNMRPFRHEFLSCEWRVCVTDGDAEERVGLGRRHKDLAISLAQALAQVEAAGGTPDAMMRRAISLLDPTPFHPERSTDSGPVREWAITRTSDMPLEDWLKKVYLPKCSYWHPVDIEDLLLCHLEPREVLVLEPPTAKASGQGGIYLELALTLGAFRAGRVVDLYSIIQEAIDRKRAKGQLEAVDGERWLVISINDVVASGQLEEACEPSAPGITSDLSGLNLYTFDEVWAIGKTFDGERCAIARFSESGVQPQLLTIPALPRG